jgi:hypothetical protein
MSKLRRLISIALVIAGAAWLAGCAQELGSSDSEVRPVAEPVLDTILEGMRTGNYAMYARYFDDIMRERIPEQRFEQLNDEIHGWIGDYKAREYVGFVNRGGMTTVVWKGRFSAVDTPVAIKVVMTRRQERPIVNGLWFEAPKRGEKSAPDE